MPANTASGGPNCQAQTVRGGRPVSCDLPPHAFATFYAGPSPARFHHDPATDRYWVDTGWIGDRDTRPANHPKTVRCTPEGCHWCAGIRDELADLLQVWTRWGRRAYNSLTSGGIRTLTELAHRSDDDLLAVRNLGMATLAYIRNRQDATAAQRGARRRRAASGELAELLRCDTSPLGSRALTALTRDGIDTVADLARRSDDDLLALRNLGASTLAHIKACQDAARKRPPAGRASTPHLLPTKSSQALPAQTGAPG